MYCICRAGMRTLAAADAFHAVRGLADVDIQRACLLTGTTVCTFFSVDPDLQNRNRIEETVDAAKRAQILTKRSVYPQRQQ